jgi:hypothetical protein
MRKASIIAGCVFALLLLVLLLMLPGNSRGGSNYISTEQSVNAQPPQAMHPPSMADSANHLCLWSNIYLPEGTVLPTSFMLSGCYSISLLCIS